MKRDARVVRNLTQWYFNVKKLKGIMKENENYSVIQGGLLGQTDFPGERSVPCTCVKLKRKIS